MAALDPQRYEIVPIGISRDGVWVLGESDPRKLELGGAVMPQVTVTPGSAQVVIPAGDGTQHLLEVKHGNDGSVTAQSLGPIDVAFPLLHGPFGEDGTVQGLLEMANIPYVGCGVFASAAGMDKHYMKIVLEAAGIPVSPYIAVTADQWSRDPKAVRTATANLTFPLYVKPARAGSSLGISRIESIDELDLAIETAHKHDPKVIIEEGIVGREVECAVLGGRAGEPAKVCAPGEIMLDVPEDTFYDFDHKYVHTEALTMQIPAAIDPLAQEAVQRTAVAAFEAFGCEGLTRVDCFVTPSGEVLVNEINTMPGFTPFSMYPALWEHKGMKYSELVDELVALALARGTGLH